MCELEDRLTSTWSALTASELAEVTVDLPTTPSPSARRAAARLAVRLHAVMYALTMLLLVTIWAITPGSYFWPVWPTLGWGLGVAVHAAITSFVLGSIDPRRRLTQR